MDAPSERKPRNRSKALPTSRLVSSNEAKDYLGIPYSSLLDRAHSGELQPIRIGRLIYFERRDLDRWIERQKVSA